MNEGTHWLSADDIAAKLGVKRNTVLAYGQDGRMPAPERKEGHRRYWSSATVEAWMTSRPGSGQYSRPPAATRLPGLYEVNAETGCWMWTGHIMANGYGYWRGLRGKRGPAHRRVYEVLAGPIPSGAQLDHLCHTRDESCPGGLPCPHRRCVNPDHMEPVTPKVNSRRVADRVTYCPQGHPYDETNTRITNGKRSCRECGRASFRHWYHERGGAELQRLRYASKR